MADEVPPILTPAQSRAARALLDWSQQELAKTAALSEVYVRKFERGERQPSEDALEALKKVLESAGIKFIPGNGEGPGVRIAKGSGKHPDPSATIPVVKAKKRARAAKGRTK